MTNQFTTPEFTDLLKKHGIEIDTPFRYGTYDGVRYVGIMTSDSWGFRALDGVSYSMNYHDTIPAYLLSQVLGWLPEYVESREKYELKGFCDTGAWFYYYGIDRDDVCNVYFTEMLNIEQLITQGLTEGWLNKEIIEQQIKQNQ